MYRRNTVASRKTTEAIAIEVESPSHHRNSDVVWPSKHLSYLFEKRDGPIRHLVFEPNTMKGKAGFQNIFQFSYRVISFDFYRIWFFFIFLLIRTFTTGSDIYFITVVHAKLLGVVFAPKMFRWNEIIYRMASWPLEIVDN